ncbi:TadE/TadG family type IV pilus assembly protein [Vibrio sp. TBV020]|uniref:TadE/TadG family type IV pilus assembly protein n=1 Tax=Vibrio sp. TBV020 TaxID=3137398 RepID=UPI0038CDC90B
MFKTKIQKGFAAIEMTLVAPFMLLLIGGIIEVSQYLQANSILIGITREGANLVSRTSSNTPNEIMTLVAKTSGELDLTSDGIMYITLVTGQEDDDPYINEQHRWSDSGLVKTSGIWDDCGNWVNHECVIATPAPTLSNFPIALEDNESVYVVEIYYEYSPLTNFFITNSFTMSDVTYL